MVHAQLPRRDRQAPAADYSEKRLQRVPIELLDHMWIYAQRMLKSQHCCALFFMLY
jgi:hypothetical protein